jgi:hypothetical protein
MTASGMITAATDISDRLPIGCAKDLTLDASGARHSAPSERTTLGTSITARVRQTEQPSTRRITYSLPKAGFH